VAELGPIVRPQFEETDVPWLLEIVHGLERDGLAAIAEEPATYDADAGTSTSDWRVRLP